MRDELLPYYEEELTFIRQMAGEFSEKYPKVAGRLQLGPHESDDPHVERLIEAFALLAGRVRHKLDDEFPELTDAVLNILYPHYLAPIPSLAVVPMVPDPARTPMQGGFLLPLHTPQRSRPVIDLPLNN